ncbi:LacI family DNA-binding transcriptional regulator [Cohnella sp. GCM10020058]|uniref:LacI family DNA-binding transcriptional regulator n=1 Tax=Cohnella sp. GCM10020058 TaxID=3317330 RepID=UPI0036324143
MVRIKDVAERAGVSVGTVSKVINNTEGVSRKTKAAVLKVIAELNYHPNLYARNMRAKSSRTIGIFVPLINEPYFLPFYDGINKRLEQIGYTPILFSGITQQSSEGTLDLLSQMMHRNLDGLIVSTYGWDDATIAKLARMAEEIPVVSYKRKFEDSPIHSVGVDDFEGMYRAASHLLQIGHRHIAYMNAAPELETSRQRLGGYRQALADHGVEERPEYIVDCPSYRIMDGYHYAHRALQTRPLPTAIIGGNDTLAIGVMKYLQELQMRIPHDIAVMGYDELPLAQLMSPQLSTMSLPTDAMTALAVDLIVGSEGGGEPARHHAFDTKLIVRGSTDMTAKVHLDYP